MSRKGKSTIADALPEDILRKLKGMSSTDEARSGGSSDYNKQASSAKPSPKNFKRKMMAGATPAFQLKVKAKGRASPSPPNPKSRQNKSAILTRPIRATFKPKTTLQTATQSAPGPTFEFWDLPSIAAVRETPPKEIVASQLHLFLQIMEAAPAALGGIGEDLFINVGLDFGTSATKVIVRLPYEAGQPTLAIPAPEFCRSYTHPYSWQTILWLRPSGEFIAFPEKGSAVLHTLKQGILDGRQNRILDLGSDFEIKPTSGEAAVAYLAYVMRYVQGWLISNRPNLVKKRSLVWSYNIGFPAASLEERDKVVAFRRIAVAARGIAEASGPIDLPSVRAQLSSRSTHDAAQTDESAQVLGLAVLTETAAEATGFFQSIGGAEGVYLLVDVGALTLDTCIFGYRGNEYRLFGVDVRPLGVEAFHWFMADGKTSNGFNEQCDRSFRSTIGYAKVHHIPQTPCWNAGRSLPVFVAGGGIASDLHLERIVNLGPWLRGWVRNEGINIVALPKLKNIDLPEKLSDLSRMGVAWGLSFPAEQIGRVIRESEMQKTEPQRERPARDFVSKDMV